MSKGGHPTPWPVVLHKRVRPYQSHARTHRRGSRHARGASVRASPRGRSLCELDRPSRASSGDLGRGEVLVASRESPRSLVRLAPATLHDLDHGRESMPGSEWDRVPGARPACAIQDRETSTKMSSWNCGAGGLPMRTAWSPRSPTARAARSPSSGARPRCHTDLQLSSIAGYGAQDPSRQARGRVQIASGTSGERLKARHAASNSGIPVSVPRRFLPAATW